MPSVEHLSSSAVQTAAEAQIVSALAEARGLSLISKPGEILLAAGAAAVRVDAATADESVVVEAYARQGKLKPGQLKKVAQDILKLALLKHEPGRENTKAIIVFADQAAHDSVTGWLRQAASVFTVELTVVSITEDLRRRIQQAQSRQVMVNLDQVADDEAAEGHLKAPSRS